MGKRDAKTRQCTKTERNLHYWSWWPRLQRNSQKCEEIIWKAHGRSHAVQKGDSHSQQKTGSGRDGISQGSKNNLWLYGGLPRIHKATSGAFSTCKNTKITSQVKVSLRWHIPTCSSQIHSYASSNEDSRCKSCSGQGMGKTRDKSQHGNWKKVKSKKEVTLEAQRDKQSSMNILKNQSLTGKDVDLWIFKI